MKKLEIKSIGVVSMGKTVVYMMIIPMALVLLIGLFTLLIGILINQSEVAIIGGAYLIMPIFLLALYSGFSMLMGLLYNWLAGKFGGLEITLAEPKKAEAPQSIIEVVPPNDASIN